MRKSCLHLRPLPPVLWSRARPRAALSPPVAPHEGRTDDLLEHVLHAQARQRPTHQGVRHQPLHPRQRPRSHPTNLRTPVDVSFLHDEITRKRKTFSIDLDVYKLAGSDTEKIRDLNTKECRKDSLKPKSVEKVRVQKVEGKHRHVLMVGAKLIEFAGNFTLWLQGAW